MLLVLYSILRAYIRPNTSIRTFIDSLATGPLKLYSRRPSATRATQNPTSETAGRGETRRARRKATAPNQIANEDAEDDDVVEVPPPKQRPAAKSNKPADKKGKGKQRPQTPEEPDQRDDEDDVGPVLTEDEQEGDEGDEEGEKVTRVATRTRSRARRARRTGARKSQRLDPRKRINPSDRGTRFAFGQPQGT
ncbi:hypothetical protein FRC08_012974 [Ceratobasidium sp. 394]|nr:hypothetical protein FRC08_012974 [Ceratobasidium sp. 394]